MRSEPPFSRGYPLPALPGSRLAAANQDGEPLGLPDKAFAHLLDFLMIRPIRDRMQHLDQLAYVPSSEGEGAHESGQRFRWMILRDAERRVERRDSHL